jgi:glycosyltransferase involved in cell wall biosynthesis
LNLDDSITFAGAKTQVEVSQALAECDCLVLPSLSEPWGLVANEALCTGIPIIVSDRCGCAADLVTQDTGWLVEAEDTQKLAEAMAAVCRLPIQHLEKMGEAAVKMACDYSPEACAHRIIGNLEDILQSKGTAR